MPSCHDGRDGLATQAKYEQQRRTLNIAPLCFGENVDVLRCPRAPTARLGGSWVAASTDREGVRKSNPERHDPGQGVPSPMPIPP